jgi:hypothetical protein
VKVGRWRAEIEAEGAATGGAGAHDDLGSVVRHCPNGVMSGPSAVNAGGSRGRATLATWGNHRQLVSSHRPMYAAPQRPESRPIAVYLHGLYQTTCAQTSARSVCTAVLVLRRAAAGHVACAPCAGLLLDPNTAVLGRHSCGTARQPPWLHLHTFHSSIPPCVIHTSLPPSRARRGLGARQPSLRLPASR